MKSWAMDLAGGLPRPLLRCALAAIGDVVEDRVVEQEGVLSHDADLLPKRTQVGRRMSMPSIRTLP